MKLFVAGLPYDMDDAEFEEFFEKFGTVTSVKVAMDRETGKSKGFAFVEMPNDDEAREAISNLDQKSIKERQISVSEARPPQEKERRPFRPGGGSGGNGGGNNRDFRRRF